MPPIIRDVAFDNEKLHQIVTGEIDRETYRTGTLIRILHKQNAEDSPIIIFPYFPESLARALWPGAQMRGRGGHRAMLWEFESELEGVHGVFTWLLRSVNRGEYSDLGIIRWRSTELYPMIGKAARQLGISRLIDAVEVAMDTGNLDAAESVTQ